MRQLAISRFRNKFDKDPQCEYVAWPELVGLLTHRSVRGQQDGPLWSPARFASGSTRTKENVESVDLLVIDIDIPCDLVKLRAEWAPYEYLLHSTHNHTNENPRYRVVFPLRESVPACRWEEVWLTLIVPLSEGCFDDACSDTSRMYYLPSCPTSGTEAAVAEHHEGKWLSETDFPTFAPQSGKEHERPGDEYNRKTSWDEILTPLGAVPAPAGRNLWVRPGKNPREGHSARTGLGDGDLLHVFTCNWPPFKAAETYSKFAAFALIHHNGDFAEAAKSLASRGFGSPATKPVGEEATGNSSATKLIALVEEQGINLYYSDQGVAFAQLPDVPVGLLKLEGREFKDWLRSAFYGRYGKSVNDQIIGEAISLLGCRARYGSPERIRVNVRVAGRKDKIWIDLGTSGGEIVEIDAEGWRIVRHSPAHFWRPRQMVPMPLPERGGRLGDLRRFVNVASDEDFMLLLAWAVMALHPQGPYPILVLTGERGSAKSTTAKVLKRLVDPSGLELRNLPNDDKDLKAAAVNSHCLVFDNLSRIHGNMSDNLCKLSTGGGISNRANYTDDEEAVFEGKRPIILTAIEDLVEKPDLLDRGLFPKLPPLLDGYRTEEELWDEFAAEAPRLLGALLDALVLGVSNYSRVERSSKFRMADFARFSEAASPAFGLGCGFYEVYSSNRESLHQNAADSSPLCSAILEIVGEDGWTGSATELVQAVLGKVGDTERKIMPAAGQIKSRLKTIMPLLRANGIEYREGREGRMRWISLTKVGANAVTPVTSVTTASDELSAASVNSGKSDTSDRCDSEKEVI